MTVLRDLFPHASGDDLAVLEQLFHTRDTLFAQLRALVLNSDKKTCDEVKLQWLTVSSQITERKLILWRPSGNEC